MIPDRLIRPTVGLMPTSPLAPDGQTIEPSVSVPTPIAARLAAIAAPVPELDPHGLRSSAYGFFTCPPRPLHPLVECVERKLAHSLRLVLPRITAPAARSCATTNASCVAIEPSSASDPAVVIIRSAVSMLSLIRIGMPCSGPRGPWRPRSASRARRDGQRIRIDLDHGPQRRTLAIDLLDPVEVHLGDLTRGVSSRTSSPPATGRRSLPRAETSAMRASGAAGQRRRTARRVAAWRANVSGPSPGSGSRVIGTARWTRRFEDHEGFRGRSDIVSVVP